MDKSTDKLKNREEIYKSLLYIAPYVPGDLSPPDSIRDIPWVDDSLIKHGVAFYCTHMNQSFFASVLMFLLSFSFKPFTAVLLKGQLGKQNKFYSRFMKDMKITAELFLLYLKPEKTAVYKKYIYIAKQHSLARKRYVKSNTKEESNLYSEPWKKELAEAVRNDLAHIKTESVPTDLLSWVPPLAISQLDMVVVQFMSIWMFWGLAELFGIKNRKEELKGVVHLWAIHGRMIGIKDEFNVCLKPDYKLYDLLTRNFLVESLKTMDETIISMQNACMEDMWKLVPFMTYKALLYVGLRELQGCEGENLWKIMRVWDKSSIYFLRGWMWLARQNAVCRFLLDIPIGIWMLFHIRDDVGAFFKRYLVGLKIHVSKKIHGMLGFLFQNKPGRE